MINTDYILPILVLVIIVVALLRHINAYHSFTGGIEDGIRPFLDICPALLVMMYTIALLRQSRLMDVLCGVLAAHIANIPKKVWPMVIFRPISGSASLAVLIDIFQVYDVDSLTGNMASIIQDFTDTAIYVVILYFSSIGIRKIKSTLAIGLLANVAGTSMAVLLALHVLA